MPAVSASKYMVNAGWDDVPHIPPDVKASMLRDTPAHLRDARSKGVPSLGAGAIYPVEESEFLVSPFAMPDWWPRVYGLDVGWNRTAAVWGALDRDNLTLYLYAEHYKAHAEASMHAAAIRARGEWIPGVIDPASGGSSQIDGRRLIEVYKALGLHLTAAENSVEAGILAVLDMLSTGRLKVFTTLSNWRAEHRLYRRNEKGVIVKAHDHLMDATRYLVVSGLTRAKTRPAAKSPLDITPFAADSTAGY